MALEVSTGWLEVALLLMLSPLQGLLLRALGEEPEPFSFEGGWRCFRGADEACLRNGDGPLRPVWWPALMHLALSTSSLLNDFAYLLLTKYGSAVYMSVADGFSAPIVALVATAPFMGPYREAPSSWVFAGCTVTTLGMVSWAKGEEQQATEETRGLMSGGLMSGDPTSGGDGGGCGGGGAGGSDAETPDAVASALLENAQSFILATEALAAVEPPFSPGFVTVQMTETTDPRARLNPC